MNITTKVLSSEVEIAICPSCSTCMSGDLQCCFQLFYVLLLVVAISAAEFPATIPSAKKWPASLQRQAKSFFLFFVFLS